MAESSSIEWSEITDAALYAAVERHLAHLFDVYFQGTDEGRLQRLMTGLQRTIDSYDAVVEKLEP